MTPRVLALDYDGTIAHDGRLDPGVADVLRAARERDLVSVLSTGRLLTDLRRLLGDRLGLFDAVVAENGALVVFPAAGRISHEAPRCARALLDGLHHRGIPARVGDHIVEMDAHHALEVLEIIRGAQLPLTLHFNRGRLMVVPMAVSKATGLRTALRALRRSPHDALGIGDAENDHELLRACEIGAAVAWGSRALQQQADVVIDGSGPADVAPFLREVIEGRALPEPVPHGFRIHGAIAPRIFVAASVAHRSALPSWLLALAPMALMAPPVGAP